MFFDGGRLYYTLERRHAPLLPVLHAREQAWSGAPRFTASNGITGMNFASATGMFVADGKLYLATSNGNLQKSDFTGGAPAGTGHRRVRPRRRRHQLVQPSAVPVRAGRAAPAANQPPTARMSVDCQDLVCSMTGDGSSDPEGLLASYAVGLR